MPDHLVVDVRERTLWVGIDRPQIRNAFNLQTIDEMIEAFTRLDEDPEIGCGVLYGVGDHFCAGGEMQAMMALDETTGHIWNNKMRRLCMLLRNCGKPTVAMVRGFCIGGGNEWQLYCDLCVASETAVFGQSGVKVGALPVVGATQYLPLIVGDRRSRDMLLRGRRLNAQEALEWGLANEVVPDAELERTVEAWCAEMNAHAP